MTIRAAILVTGSRRWSDRATIGRMLLDLAWDCYAANDTGDVEIEFTLIHGNCRGFDLLAASCARQFGWKVEAYPAEDYGRWPECGPIRNSAMVKRLAGLRDQGWTCRVLAGPMPRMLLGARSGTDDCMRKAQRSGFEPRVIAPGDRP